MNTTLNLGNLDPTYMRLDELMMAVQSTWELPDGAPHLVKSELVTQVVQTTSEANRNAGRTMGYGATLAWGIAIGVHAERLRAERCS